MAHSYAEDSNFHCSQCGRHTTESVWSIVDIDERPDLFQKLMAQIIHDLSCSHCGKSIEKVEAPLLIFRPKERPKLMFSPAASTIGTKVAEQHFWQLVERLRVSLGSDWDKQWVESGVMTVGREFLPDFLADGEGTEKRTREIARFFDQLTTEQKQLFVQLHQHKDNPEEMAKLLSQHPDLAAAMNRREQENKSSRTLPSNLSDILRALSQPEKGLQDMARREQLCRQALALVSRERSSHVWASLQSEIAKCLLLKLTGDRAQNIENAIAAYHLSLEVFTRRSHPREWGLVNIGLGPAYFERIQGNRSENAEKAIAALESAFQTISKETMPFPWAMAKVNLSNIYTNRVEGNHSQNNEQAIIAARQSLEVLTRQHTVEWAKAQNALSNAYFQRTEGKRDQNIEDAITFALQALEFFTREETPIYWAMAQMNLGNAYSKRGKGQRARNIEEAIMAYNRALEFLSRQNSPREWAMVQRNLANAYSRRVYSETADNVEAAIKANRLCLQIYTKGDFPDQWAVAQASLADTYLGRIRGVRAENIEAAIEAAEKATEVHTRSLYPKDWARAQVSLANAYGDRIRGDRAQNIEKSIAIYQETLEVYTREDFPDRWATVHENLAHSYGERIRGDRAENIELGIKSVLQASEVHTHKDAPHAWASNQHSLCVLYRERVAGSRAENMEESINSALRALKVIEREDSPRTWGSLQHDLANAYFSRVKDSHAQNIEKAITAYNKALEVRTKESFPSDWALTKSSLANAYKERLTGDRIQNVELAISASQEALEVYTKADFPEHWALINSNLISAYRTRIKGDRSQNIETALEIALSTLKVYTYEDFPYNYSVTQNNLGNAYKQRTQGDRSENIESAIECFNQALRVVNRENFPQDWARTQDNLATTYATRPKGSHRENMEKTIEILSTVLEHTDRYESAENWAMAQMNIATAYSQRVSGDRARNIEDSLNGYSAALEVYTREDFPEKWALLKNNIATTYTKRVVGNSAQNIQNAIKSYCSALEVFQVETLPKNCQFTATLLANLYVEQTRWSEAASTYKTAVAAAEIVYSSAILQSSRSSELDEIDDLYHRAAFACARKGNIDEAITLLEQGRARSLRETLERDRADLSVIKQIAPTVYENYWAAAALSQSLEVQERAEGDSERKIGLPDLREQAQRSQKLLRQSISEVRKIPGHENFLSLPTFTDIQETIQPLQPLVYLVATSTGGLGIIVSKSETDEISTQVLFLNDFSNTVLKDLVASDSSNSWLTNYQRYRQDPDAHYQKWLQTIERVSNALWEPLMRPVVERLQAQRATQAVLIPCGLLGFLPLHIARTPDEERSLGYRYAMDNIQFTYSPNAMSLKAARYTCQQTNHHNSMLAISNPSKDLEYSDLEVEAAISQFNRSSILKHEAATRAAVLSALPNHAVLHFSCHGQLSLDDPLESHLAMSGQESLTLRDFFNARLQDVRLAVLSACETALPDARLPDEVIGLPNGILQAGAAGVAASLWLVNDFATALLMTKFYDLWRNTFPAPAKALYEAQKWIRDTTVEEKRSYLKSLRANQSSIPTETASSLYNAFFDLILSNVEALNFEHPYYWAAFTYIGA